MNYFAVTATTILFCSIFTGTLAANDAGKKADNPKLSYNNPPLQLYADRIVDTTGETTLADLPDSQPVNKTQLKNATPIIERLWCIALADVESNIIAIKDGYYFGAGRQFGPRVYTRDISISGILGLNRLYPNIMRSSLEYTRNVHWNLGFKVMADHKVKEINVDWQVVPEDIIEFSSVYPTDCYTRRTDDVIWLWCAGDLIQDSTDKKDWQWLYDWGNRFFERFYNPFYDPNDGLYRGQAVFMDIHYGVRNSNAYPQNWSISDCVLIKATSTNCAYVAGMRAMAKAAEKLGLDAQSKQWLERAEKLKKAICRELRHPDGTFTYYKDRWGKLAPRREALGTAFAVLLDIVDGDNAIKALAGYPVTDIGIPSYYPFFEDNDMVYHNNTSWPFVNAFFIRALDKADGGNRIGQSFVLMARCCKNPGGFREYIDYKDKTVKGSASQLWTAAGFIDVCFRAGLVSEIVPYASKETLCTEKK
jgi:hypothetical protein